RGQTTGFLGILRDISQRKAAETALRESEEHLRAIIELEPECVKLVSREGTLLEMNPAGLAMIEADSIEQVRGAPVASIVAPEDRERFAVLHRRAANGETVRGEFVIKSLRGTHRWMETHEVPYRDARGEIVAVLGITRDITERKSVQEALASKVQELSAIYSNAPGIIFYLKVEGDEEFRFVSVNDALLKATGLREEQVVGKSVREVIPPSSLAVVLAHYQEAIRTGKVVRWEETSEYPAGTKHGEVSVTPQFGADGVCTQLIGVVHDVTERKRADQALRESEERLCTLSEATFEGIAISENGVMLDCNEQLAEMFGRPRTEVIGKRIVDFIAPEYRSNVAEAQRSGRTDPYENALLRADGTSCPVVTRARYLQIGGRQVRITAVQDNTERMEREQALRESEARYRRIVETAEEGIWMIDPQAKTSFANPKMAQMLGCTVEEMTGRDLYEFMDDEGRAISERNIARRKQGIAEQHDFKFRRKDGSAMWALLKTSPIRDADGTYAGALAMITDITARKNAEAALRKSEERYRELFDANPHPMWVYDLESLRFLAVNNAAIAHYGYSREELLTMTLKDIRPPEDIPALLASARKAGGNFVEATVWRHRKRDGTLIDVEITAHGIEFAGHRAEVVLASDVTERRRSEVRLLQAEDAERRRIAKELHDSTAQDLVAVIMNLGAVQGLIPSDGAKAARILEDSIALVENSVNEIRTLSYVLHPPQLDETGLAGALAEYAAGFTARTDTRIRVEVAPDLGRLPEDMEIVLFRVVQEGIANVLRHSGSDMATIRLGRTDENVVLEVEDYGRGMADAGARGVGIAGMKERLQYLGGRLEVESGSGGTIIRAVLPLREIQK
ncbi:MAG: PAS domain S-box protein, partial [Chthoniobacteraceae bacterium]